jgi:hypothetical protein
MTYRALSEWHRKYCLSDIPIILSSRVVAIESAVVAGEKQQMDEGRKAGSGRLESWMDKGKFGDATKNHVF